MFLLLFSFILYFSFLPPSFGTDGLLVEKGKEGVKMKFLRANLAQRSIRVSFIFFMWMDGWMEGVKKKILRANLAQCSIKVSFIFFLCGWMDGWMDG